MTDGASLVDVERTRSEAAASLLKHEIACERRYGEIRTELGGLKKECARNTKLLWALLAGMVAVAGRSFWPGLFGG